MTLLSRLNLESMGVFGLDPVLVLGLMTVGSGGVGWLLGPFVGNAVFGVVHRRVGGQIAEVSFVFFCSFGGAGMMEGGELSKGRVLTGHVCAIERSGFLQEDKEAQG